MIFVFLLCFLFAASIAVFVLKPVISSGTQHVTRMQAGFADEQELRATLILRDSLLRKLAFGRSDNPQIESLSEQDTFDGVLAICQRLQKAGLPFLPKTLVVLLILGFLGQTTLAFAQNGRMEIPEALQTSQNELVPRLHQFSLNPGEGVLLVRYVGYFSWNSAAGEALVVLPLPEGSRELKVPEQKDAILLQSAGGYPILKMPVKPGNIHVQAEFTLEASGGVAQFQSSKLTSLPGTVLVFMPEYQGGLRNFLGTFVSDVNVWPARIANVPTDFQSTVSQDSYDPSEPNYKMLMRMPPQFTRRVIRFGKDESPYPHFEVVGIVPPRTGLLALAGCFTTFLFGFSLLALRKFNNSTPKI